MLRPDLVWYVRSGANGTCLSSVFAGVASLSRSDCRPARLYNRIKFIANNVHVHQ